MGLGKKEEGGVFEGELIPPCTLSKKKLTWWENKMTATKSLKKLPIETAIYIDASLEGWGGGGEVGQFVKNLRQEACGPNKSSTHQCS